MRSKNGFVRSASAVVLAIGVLGVTAPAARAAPPSNDLFGGATPATTGFAEVLDTTQATTDANDSQLNSSCGAPATAATMLARRLTGRASRGPALAARNVTTSSATQATCQSQWLRTSSSQWSSSPGRLA